MTCPMCGKTVGRDCTCIPKRDMHTWTRARRGFSQAWCEQCKRWEFIPEQVYERLMRASLTPPVNGDVHGQ